LVIFLALKFLLSDLLDMCGRDPYTYPDLAFQVFGKHLLKTSIKRKHRQMAPWRAFLFEVYVQLMLGMLPESGEWGLPTVTGDRSNSRLFNEGIKCL
jgi:hypothetical protein